VEPIRPDGPALVDDPRSMYARGPAHGRFRPADTLRRVMADNKTPRRPASPESGANQGWAAVAYLMGGIAVWGGVGWLVDRWVGTKGIFTAIGCVLGAVGGIYLVVRKLGA
jgi:ATP synthase protein I